MSAPIVVVFILTPLAGSIGRSDGSEAGEPYFDANTPYNVSAHIGKSAFLTCIVHNVGNLSVSWVRHRDIHILTVGAYTYTSDQRFMSLHEKDSSEWTLQIKWVQKRDAGIYECQVSTIPVKSLFVQLYVVVPSAVIHGRSDVHVEHGSTINLTCSINYGTEPPAYIFWYHHDKRGKVAVVNYDSERGGISVITVKAEVSTSHLVIRGAVEADAGKYYCSPSNADVAYVYVHVHSRKSPSAIQKNSGSVVTSCWAVAFILSAYIYLILGHQSFSTPKPGLCLY